ncbi:FtsX-like permease family protein [Methanobrevibacter sp.]|uniref:ABC transporter permease n=1 Tax=Methanobrevibacter sp. TaxID=66852 RepID=UPI00388E1400
MLAKKMIRDIRKHKAQFISIFLMAFLGVFVFTGVSSEYMGNEAHVNDYYEETNLADGWIYSPVLNDLFLYQVDVLGPTTQMERQLVVDSVADFENNPEITLHFVENNTISKFYLLEGKPLDINDSDGVWLDKDFADAKGLKIGDRISFESEGKKIDKEIKGLGYSPEYVYHGSDYSVIPDHNKIGFAYMSYKAFPDNNISYNVLNVKFDGSPSTFSKLLDFRLNGYYSTFVQQSDHPSVHRFSENNANHKMMAGIFPVVFIIVTLLILLTTMTRIIAHQRMQIGILKASGFKNSTIILHYVSYGFWLVLFGSILGLFLGPKMIPLLFYPSMMESFTLPSWGPGWDMSFIILIVLMSIFSIAVSYYAISIISNEKPSQSIKPRAPKVSTSGFVERLKIWKKLSFNFRWNYRDAKRNKVRSLMTIIGVMGCTALLIGAFGLYDGMNDVKGWEYGHINHYESKLIFDDNASSSQIDAAVSHVNGEKIMDKSIEIESKNAKKLGSLLVLNDTHLITPTDKNKNQIEIGNDEVSISQKMADMLNVSIGDTVKWHIMESNKWIDTRIDGIHADPVSQGFIMSQNKLEGLGLNYTPTSIITSEHVSETYDGIKTTTTLNDIENDWDKLTETVWLIIYVLSFFACILAVIVLYNLGLLSFTEIEREIATLKVLGFKTRDLRRLLLTQNLIFTAIGFVLGIPLGLYVLDLMWTSSETSFYVIPSLTITNLLLSGVITFSLSILVNLMFSRRIKNLDMVESLKSGE